MYNYKYRVYTIYLRYAQKIDRSITYMHTWKETLQKREKNKDKKGSRGGVCFHVYKRNQPQVSRYLEEEQEDETRPRKNIQRGGESKHVMQQRQQL